MLVCVYISVYACICVRVCLCEPTVLRDLIRKKKRKTFCGHLQNVAYEQSVLVIQHIFLNMFFVAAFCGHRLKVGW